MSTNFRTYSLRKLSGNNFHFYDDSNLSTFYFVFRRIPPTFIIGFPYWGRRDVILISLSVLYAKTLIKKSRNEQNLEIKGSFFWVRV